MSDDLRTQITAEIKRVKVELDQRKRLIKDNVADTLVIETLSRK